MPTQGILAPTGPRPLGRDSSATVAHWDAIRDAMPEAPTIMRGELPRKSPPIWRFMNPRPHYQVIGMCVGRSACRMKELLLRIPEDADAASNPLPAVDLSSLYDYWIARAYSRAQGIRLGADGAIVSHSVLAGVKDGACALRFWPDDERSERAYTDRRAPDPEDFADGRSHLITRHAMIPSLRGQLEYLAQGYAVQTGMPVSEGWLQTDEHGWFRERGSEIGGHATCTVGYDLDAGWVAILNSWAGWGRRSTDPMFSITNGYTNIGYYPMEDYERQFSDTAMARGDSEAIVVNTVGGFDRPKIRFDWANLYGSAEDLPA